jgi:type II secretory pathway pseudopilin PulG
MMLPECKRDCPMIRRPAATLVEVLVAIFVMAIGLLALLTLFPIGALSMAKAIMDQRSAEAAVIAQGHFIARNFGSDPLVLSDPTRPIVFGYNNSPTAPPGDMYTNPYSVANHLPNANPGAPSYPVFIDPVGWNSAGIPKQRWWVGNVMPPALGAFAWPNEVPANISKVGCLARCSVKNAGPNYRTAFTLWDDLTDVDADSTVPGFGPGTPLMVGNNCVRDPRLSWAYLCQRPYASDPTVVNYSVVVFDRRPIELAEYVYAPSVGNTSYFDDTNNLITIDYTGNVPPPLKAGDWILDVTLDQRYDRSAGIPGANPPPTYLNPHAFYYRIVGVKEFTDGIATVGPVRQLAQYEVQTPLRGFHIYDANGNLVGVPFGTPPVLLPNATTLTSVTSLGGIFLGYPGSTIVMEGVVEVFEKGPCRLP